MIDNTTIEDNRLSFKALGLLTYLLSRPDGWQVRTKHLASTHGEGEYAVRQALTELEQHGYLERRQEREDDGKFITVTVVHEVPADAITAQRDAITATRVTATAETATGVKKEEAKTEVANPPDGGHPRRPNPPWDALVTALGWEPRTKQEKTRVGRAVREILAALPDGTPPEDAGKHIAARAMRYKREWPDAELTPEALVKHWSRFAPGQRRPRPAASPAAGGDPAWVQAEWQSRQAAP